MPEARKQKANSNNFQCVDAALQLLLECDVTAALPLQIRRVAFTNVETLDKKSSVFVQMYDRGKISLKYFIYFSDVFIFTNRNHFCTP